MSYGDLGAQLKERGAIGILSSATDKATRFVYQGQNWTCAGKARTLMTSDLADGYEMGYCLTAHCSTTTQPLPDS